MPADDVPFSAVIDLLEQYGYRFLRRRTDPNDKNVGFAIFGRPESPLIGFPVQNKRVPNAYFEKIKRLLAEAEDHEGGCSED
jgi:hypothetical protein